MGFAQEGADVLVNYVRDSAAAEATANAIRQLGRRAYVIQADAAKKRYSPDVREAVDVFGRVDILVNNAGINKRGWFLEVTDEDWDMILEPTSRAHSSAAKKFSHT